MKKLFLTDTEFAILEDLLMAVPDEVSDRLDCDEMSSRVLDRRTNNYKEVYEILLKIEEKEKANSLLINNLKERVLNSKKLY